MKRLILSMLVVMLALVTAGGSGGPAAMAQTSVASSGVVCTTSPTNEFVLNATPGYIGMPDGNTIYMWGLGLGTSGNFQYPGPVLCVPEDAAVTVTLHNNLPPGKATSLIFPGQETVTANGAPAQPQFSGTTLSSLVQSVAPGSSITYSFVASEPGTYIYESGTNPGIQVQMGLFGAIVVRPAMDAANPGRAFAYNYAGTEYNPAHEYLMIHSEIDATLHQTVERNRTFNLKNYRPRYTLINGRGFPDTIAPNGASWLPGQPYSSLAHIYPYSASNPLPALVRYVGATASVVPFHPHGNHSRVIGRDGAALIGPNGEDLSYEKFSLPIGPGQTWDIFFTWRDAENFGASNPIPVTVPNLQNLTAGAYWSGDPYLGGSGTLPIGGEGYNQCGEYYHVAHSHDLTNLSSWGLVNTGSLTYTRIDPPLPNSCP